MAKYQKHIVVDYSILLGKPVSKDTRITVESILKKLSEGATIKEVSIQYNMSLEKIQAALEYASARLGGREEIINLSLNPKRIISTEDKDFGEWVFAHKTHRISLIFLRYRFQEQESITTILTDLILKERLHLFGFLLQSRQKKFATDQ